MLKIKDFAKLCGCSMYTLRYYDQIGVLKPHIIHHHSGYRFYKEEQLQEFLEIKQFQDIGFAIDEIKILKTLQDDEIVQAIYKKIKELEEDMEKAHTLRKKYASDER